MPCSLQVGLFQALCTLLSASAPRHAVCRGLAVTVYPRMERKGKERPCPKMPALFCILHLSQNIPRAGCTAVSLHYGLGWEFSHDCNGLNCTQGSKLQIFLIAGFFFSLYSALGEHILPLRLGAVLLPCSES